VLIGGLLAVGALFLIKDYDVYVVSGDAMYPTFAEGDRVVIDKSADAYERYDLIVFENAYGGGGYYIERIIGLPGETVQIQEGVIYINGEPLAEPYYYEADFNGYDAYEEMMIGEGEYFVLGDNRNHSADSRLNDFGMVKLESITGKAIFRMWPMDAIGSLQNQ